MQHEFLEKYYNEFEDSEENKFIYTDIHREYVSTLLIIKNYHLTVLVVFLLCKENILLAYSREKSFCLSALTLILLE